MFSKIWTQRSTETFSVQIERLQEALARAEVVLIGAGAGLSTAAGFTYSGERFHRYFDDFGAKYGFQDMYTGGFYPYETPEEHWAYWSRYIWINRYQEPPKPVYRRLLELVKDKNYFVLTTNVDHCFQKAGFDKERLFYTQGDYGLFQCSGPCCRKTWDNEAQIRRMVAEQKDMQIPSGLIPRCPVCGRPLTMNLRADNKFVEDGGWHAAAQRYQSFLHCAQDKKLLLLELGVGGNTPGIIKYPFWQLAAGNPQAVYVCVNLGEAFAPEALGQRALCIDRDIGQTLEALL